jgi:hypothetical protein
MNQLPDKLMANKKDLEIIAVLPHRINLSALL